MAALTLCTLHAVLADKLASLICAFASLPKGPFWGGYAGWVGLGEDAARLIITRDKTHVQGDLLVDDKPRVSGSRTASWTHVLFNQSYNKSMEGKARLSAWSEWADALSNAF